MRRQQILVLWLAESALDSEVVAWAFHDGSRGAGRPLPGADGPVPNDDPPYASGVAALEDGWWLLQAPHVPPPVPGREAEPGYLQYEFVFERAVEAQVE
jgi:hypothetical protein